MDTEDAPAHSSPTQKWSPQSSLQASRQPETAPRQIDFEKSHISTSVLDAIEPPAQCFASEPAQLHRDAEADFEADIAAATAAVAVEMEEREASMDVEMENAEGPEDVEVKKKQERRKEDNRKSAQRTRERQDAYVKWLEQKLLMRGISTSGWRGHASASRTTTAARPAQKMTPEQRVQNNRMVCRLCRLTYWPTLV